MSDVIFVMIVLAFFALTTAYVRACAAIVGPVDVSDSQTVGDLHGAEGHQ